MFQKKQEYISLREAAKLSGYTPDYLGQLIRSGKLEGKQVFSNVSWVTTEDALRAYASSSKKSRQTTQSRKSFLRFFGLVGGGASLEHVERVYNMLAWAVIAIVLIFTLLLGYVLAVSIDQRIEEAYVEKSAYAK